MEQIIGGAPAAAAGDLIKDSNSRNFAADVIEASNDTPVIVDFWAPWRSKNTLRIYRSSCRAAILDLLSLSFSGDSASRCHLDD